MTTATLADLASSAVDTLLVLLKHRTKCPQCLVDERFCDTAGDYQRLFMEEVRRYERLKEAAR